MDKTREYFAKVNFVKAVEKIEELESIPNEVVVFSESLKPRIEELKKRFQDYRNSNNIK